MILEVVPDSIHGIIASIDEKKHIRLERYLPRVTPAWMQRAAKLERLQKNIIIAADSSLVVTSVLPVKLVRTAPQSPLTAIELENLLSQAVGRLFNQCRTEASRELKVDDLDTLLVNSQVINFKIDGHNVLNPIGFKARTVEAVLELTLTTRPVFERLKELLDASSGFFFTEIGRSILLMLDKVAKPPIQLLMLSAQGSRYFVLHRAAIGHFIQRGAIAWSTTELVQAFSEEFMVSKDVARHMYERYLERDLSKTALQHAKKLVDARVQSLIAALRSSRLKGTVYGMPDLPLPFSTPHKFKNGTLTEIPLYGILEKVGLAIDRDEWPLDSAHLLRYIGPFLEYYYRRDESQINQWLKRHLNWLGAPADRQG